MDLNKRTAVRRIPLIRVQHKLDRSHCTVSTMSVSVTPHLFEERLVGLFVGPWDATHALVNVRQPLDERLRPSIAIRRFLAGDANSFRQCQFPGAREPSHGLYCGFVLDVERHIDVHPSISLAITSIALKTSASGRRSLASNGHDNGPGGHIVASKSPKMCAKAADGVPPRTNYVRIMARWRKPQNSGFVRASLLRPVGAVALLSAVLTLTAISVARAEPAVTALATLIRR
jgi:hypothetical protein